jgi:hypothetical protein
MLTAAPSLPEYGPPASFVGGGLTHFFSAEANGSPWSQVPLVSTS